MRRIIIAAALVSTIGVGACKQTGNGDVVVDRPAISTTKDTIHTPTVEVGKDTHTVITPSLEVHRDSSGIHVQARKDTNRVVTPTVKVKP